MLSTGTSSMQATRGLLGPLPAKRITHHPTSMRAHRLHVKLGKVGHIAEHLFQRTSEG